MKLIIDINDNSVASFMKMAKAYDFINDVKEYKEKRKNRFVKGLAASFNEVKLYNEGKKDLKNAKDLLNELRSQSH